jgi:hypothetical protein
LGDSPPRAPSMYTTATIREVGNFQRDIIQNKIFEVHRAYHQMAPTPRDHAMQVSSTFREKKLQDISAAIYIIATRW